MDHRQNSSDPNYRLNSLVDLTLKVEVLIDPHSGQWKRTLIYDTFCPQDAEIILKTHSNISQQDKWVWGFTKTGVYDAKSGYKLLETMEEMNLPDFSPTPPLEKQLWSGIWKSKTSPKLRHFL